MEARDELGMGKDEVEDTRRAPVGGGWLNRWGRWGECSNCRAAKATIALQLLCEPGTPTTLL